MSLTEALYLSTPSGRAMAGLLSVFAEFERDLLRERVKAGIAQAKAEGRTGGRPLSAALKVEEANKLRKKGLSKSENARQLEIRRTSVRRLLDQNGSAALPGARASRRTSSPGSRRASSSPRP